MGSLIFLAGDPLSRYCCLVLLLISTAFLNYFFSFGGIMGDPPTTVAASHPLLGQLLENYKALFVSDRSVPFVSYRSAPFVSYRSAPFVRCYSAILRQLTTLLQMRVHFVDNLSKSLKSWILWLLLTRLFPNRLDEIGNQCLLKYFWLRGVLTHLSYCFKILLHYTSSESIFFCPGAELLINSVCCCLLNVTLQRTPFIKLIPIFLRHHFCIR